MYYLLYTYKGRIKMDETRTIINITKDLREELKKLKITKRDSYEEIIRRMMKK